MDLARVATQFGLRPIRTLQERAGRVVAQAGDDQGRKYSLKVAEKAGAFAGDIAANRLLAPIGVPVPEVIDYQHGPPAVAVLGWVDGEPLGLSSPPAAQREIGRLLRMVHSLPADATFSGERTVHGWIRAWTGELAAWWSSAGGSGSQVQRLLGWLDDLEPVLVDRRGSLTLFDGRADHFLIRDRRVVGVIDLHDVGSGDPAMDLAVVGLDDDRLIPPVLRGYMTDADQIDELNLLVPFYLLLRRLAGAEWHFRLGSEGKGRRLLTLAVDSLERGS